MLAIVATYSVTVVALEPERAHRDVGMTLGIATAIALIAGVAGAWLMVPPMRLALERERARPAPPRAEVVRRAWRFGFGMCVVALLPFFIGGLFLVMGPGAVPHAAVIGPAVWLTLLIVSGGLMMRASRAGSLLAIVTCGLAVVGMFASLVFAESGRGSVLIFAALMFVALPRVLAIHKDLGRTSDS